MLCVNGMQLLVIVHLCGTLKQLGAKCHKSLRTSRDWGGMEALSTLVNFIHMCALSVVLLFPDGGSAFGSVMNQNSSLGNMV